MMNYAGPYHYTLIIEQNRILRKLKQGEIVNFSKPLTEDKRHKLYVIAHPKEIIYVGTTTQSIATRLRYGLKSNGKKGYYGYAWKHLNQVDLLVFVFDGKISNNLQQNKKYKHFAEAIEAELVYLVRRDTGNWPTFQNEIHFNNESRSSVSGYAESMYEYDKESQTQFIH